MTRTVPRFNHVLALSDGVGIFEHARFRQPRFEHGYCVDDVARALVAVCRDDDPEATTGLADTYLRFLLDAQMPDGSVVNRRDTDGNRHGAGSVEDCWGRALWGLGTAASRSQDPALARRAAAGFARGAVRRSPWPRAMAFAGLGAAEVLRSDPDPDPGAGTGHDLARALLRDAAAAAGRFRGDRPWPWPEPRLTYANAVFPDVLMAAGEALGDDGLVAQGLEMLDWLFALQVRAGHLSLVPASGWATGEPLPAFDQQPIEASTLADAFARAYEVTGDARWADALTLATAWFFGRNDSAVCLYDEESGGCCDGLEPLRRNENQGAESTLALVTTLQHSGRVARDRR